MIETAAEISVRSQMSPPFHKEVYCCVVKADKVVYSYNSAGEELEALAAGCLVNAPSFHHWYVHTVGLRSFGFLMADGHTYFAIVEPSLGSLGVVRFLENIRDAHKKAPKNALQEELISVIKNLVASLEYRRLSSLSIEESSEGNDVSPTRKQPLLENGMHGEKDDDRVVRVDVPPEPAGVTPLTMSLSSSSARMLPLAGHELWRSHAKIVIVLDIALCLVLFAVWLGICRGFHCVS